MLSRTTKLLLVVALVAGTLSMAAPTANAVPTKTVKVRSGDRWKPWTAHLYTRGGKGIVKWKNPTNQRDHNVKSINEGSTWKLPKTRLRPKNKNVVKKTFRRPGIFWFICKTHAAKVGGKWTGMVGKVKVH